MVAERLLVGTEHIWRLGKLDLDDPRLADLVHSVIVV